MYIYDPFKECLLVYDHCDALNYISNSCVKKKNYISSRSLCSKSLNSVPVSATCKQLKFENEIKIYKTNLN